MTTPRRNQNQAIWIFILLIIIGLAWWYLQNRNSPSGPVTTGGPCGQMFAYGRPTASTLNHTTFLCRAGYATLEDTSRKVPLYSAEHLNAQGLRNSVTRTNDFAPDPDLPAGSRAELSDYSRSGYDRGHMAPAADATDSNEMHQTFYLSNMVPQNKIMNEQIWAGLEAATRACALRLGDLYVITGPIFTGNRTIGRDKVAVPDKIFKVALDAKSGQFRAFVMPNVSLKRTVGFSRYETSIADVEQQSGLNFFPQGKLQEGAHGTLCASNYGQ